MPKRNVKPNVMKSAPGEVYMMGQGFFKEKQPADLVHMKRFIPQETHGVRPFREAYHFLCENQDWTLCHGYVVEGGSRRHHAWCEKGSQVFDPRFLKPFHHDLTRLEPRVKYTYREARARVRLHRRYAKWEEKWDWGFWKYTK